MTVKTLTCDHKITKTEIKPVSADQQLKRNAVKILSRQTHVLVGQLIDELGPSVHAGERIILDINPTRQDMLLRVSLEETGDDIVIAQTDEIRKICLKIIDIANRQFAKPSRSRQLHSGSGLGNGLPSPISSRTASPTQQDIDGDLAKRLSALEAENAALKEQNANLTLTAGRVTELTDQVNRYEEEFDTAKKVVEDAIDELRTRAEKAEQWASSSKEQLEQAQADFDKKLQALAEKELAARQRAEELQRQLSESTPKAEAESAISALKDAVAAAQVETANAVKAKDEATAAHSEQIAQLQAQIDLLSARADSETLRATKLEGEIAELRRNTVNKADSETRISQLESALKTAQAAKEASPADSIIEGERAELISNRQKIRTLESDVEKLETDLRVARDTAQSFEEESIRANERAKQKEQELEQAYQVHEDKLNASFGMAVEHVVQERTTALEGRITVLSAELAAMTADRDQIDRSKREKNAQLEAYRKELEVALDKNKALEKASAERIEERAKAVHDLQHAERAQRVTDDALENAKQQIARLEDQIAHDRVYLDAQRDKITELRAKNRKVEADLEISDEEAGEARSQASSAELAVKAQEGFVEQLIESQARLAERTSDALDERDRAIAEQRTQAVVLEAMQETIEELSNPPSPRKLDAEVIPSKGDLAPYQTPKRSRRLEGLDLSS